MSPGQRRAAGNEEPAGRDEGVRVGRVYDAPSPGDGRRVLVDRLWPRGMRTDDPRIGDWLPEVAPSTELRRWYAHEPSRYEEFARRYAAELDGPAQAEALARLREGAATGAVTLLTATREPAISHAAVLAGILEEAHG